MVESVCETPVVIKTTDAGSVFAIDYTEVKHRGIQTGEQRVVTL